MLVAAPLVCYTPAVVAGDIVVAAAAAETLAVGAEAPAVHKTTVAVLVAGWGQYSQLEQEPGAAVVGVGLAVVVGAGVAVLSVQAVPLSSLSEEDHAHTLEDPRVICHLVFLP